MPKSGRAPVRDRLFTLGCIVLVIDIGAKAVIATSMIVRAGAIFGLVALAFGVGTVFGRQQERRKLDPGGRVEVPWRIHVVRAPGQ